MLLCDKCPGSTIKHVIIRVPFYLVSQRTSGSPIISATNAARCYSAEPTLDVQVRRAGVKALTLSSVDTFEIGL